MSAKEQREVVAAAAREEAAAVLKRRPSKIKPKPSLAPRQVADSSEPEAEAVVEVPAVVVPYTDADRGGDKKVVKKVVKSKVPGRGGREERCSGSNRPGKRKGGGKPGGKQDMRQQQAAKHGFESPGCQGTPPHGCPIWHRSGYPRDDIIVR